MLTEKQKRIIDIYTTVMTDKTITEEEEDKLLTSAETLALLSDVRKKTIACKKEVPNCYAKGS